MDLELDELVKECSDIDDETLQLVDLTKRLSKAQTKLEFITILQKILKRDDIKNGFINTIEKKKIQIKQKNDTTFEHDIKTKN